jgi:hypothetical protein
MKIIQRTPTRLEIRYRPMLQWFGSLILMGLSVVSIIEFNAYFGWTAFWFLVLLGSVYAFFVWHKIIHCLADETTQTLYIRKHNLIQTKTQQTYFFSEVSNLEVREKYSKNGRYYLAFLTLKSGETIYLGRGDKWNLKSSLRPLAKLIDCHYNFVPRQSLWNLF